MGSYVKNKDRAASKEQKAVPCSYDSNFYLMVIVSTHAEETSTCTASWKFHVTEQNV
jgi:hypothetical protein